MTLPLSFPTQWQVGEVAVPTFVGVDHFGTIGEVALGEVAVATVGSPLLRWLDQVPARMYSALLRWLDQLPGLYRHQPRRQIILVRSTSRTSGT